MKRLRGKLTYANVIATLALFIALGGASYAAIKVPKNSVGAKQIKNGAITGAKIKDGAVSGAKLAAGAIETVPNAINAIHATSADTATRATSADTATRATTAGNAATLGGSPASEFAPASLIRSALVEGGTVVASESVGISQANLISNEPGVYCIGGLNPPLGAKKINFAEPKAPHIDGGRARCTSSRVPSVSSRSS